MSSHPENSNFSNDAEITILKASEGVSDYPTPRPLSGAALKRALEYLEKQAKLRQMMEQMKKTESEAKPTDTNPK